MGARHSGYDGDMSESSNEHETPDVGVIADEELPEDLQPTDDNPLAKDPDDSDGSGDAGDGAGPSGEKKADGLPDMGEPGPA